MHQSRLLSFYILFFSSARKTRSLREFSSVCSSLGFLQSIDSEQIERKKISYTCESDNDNVIITDTRKTEKKIRKHAPKEKKKRADFCFRDIFFLVLENA